MAPIPRNKSPCQQLRRPQRRNSRRLKGESIQRSCTASLGPRKLERLCVRAAFAEHLFRLLQQCKLPVRAFVPIIDNIRFDRQTAQGNNNNNSCAPSHFTLLLFERRCDLLACRCGGGGGGVTVSARVANELLVGGAAELAVAGAKKRPHPAAAQVCRHSSWLCAASCPSRRVAGRARLPGATEA